MTLHHNLYRSAGRLGRTVAGIVLIWWAASRTVTEPVKVRAAA